jgi:hypothetical protein
VTDHAPSPSRPLLERLRSPATVFYEYAVDEGALLREAAGRIAELEARVADLEAELHATDVARLELLAERATLVELLEDAAHVIRRGAIDDDLADQLADQARRFVAIQAEQAAERDDGRVPVPERDLARLVELARAGAQAGIIAGRGLSGDDAHLLVTYAELLGLLEDEP